MSISWARASRIASSCPKDFDFQHFIYQSEGEYDMWRDMGHFLDTFYVLPDQVLWNMIMCWSSIVAVVIHTMEYESSATLHGLRVTTCIDIFFNVFFALYILTYMFQETYKIFHEKMPVSKMVLLFYFIDILSYFHYPAYYIFDYDVYYTVKIICYYWRWHGPLEYLLKLMDYSLKGSVITTLFKYLHLTIMVRVFTTSLFNYMTHYSNWDKRPFDDPPEMLANTYGIAFARHYYDVVKMFIPIKPDRVTRDDYPKLEVAFMNLVGALLIMIPVASLALIIGLYMSPEERFRSRFRIIMNEMKLTRVPLAMQKKVETFYRMYWHKQKAVSKTELLGTFPPALITACYMDIYFEAVQKSQILRDLSYQFLSEIAKFMTTTNYVPGDTILKRNCNKNTIVYIAYGDVEMLTAEDDQTPILRFTRGSILNPCGGCVEVGSSKSHVAIRAATFCTAHVLKTSDLWNVAEKYGKYNGQSFILHSSFEEHMEKVKRHYRYRDHPIIEHRSSIAQLKQNLIALKKARAPNGRLLLRRADMFLQIAGCYLMRNQKGSTFLEQSDDICLRSSFPCIVQPSSSLLICWHCFVALLTMAVVIIHPLQMVFYKTMTTKFIFFNHMATFVFAIDIITHLSTGAKLEAGVPITFTETSSQQMKSYWFVLDVLAIVPVFEFIGEGHYSGITKLIKLSKVFRVLKSLETVFMYHTSVLRFSSYCLLLFTMIYLLGVLQQFFSCNELNSCLVTDVGRKGYWQPSTELNDESPRLQLLASYYWSLCMVTLTDHKTAVRGTKNWQALVFWVLTLEVCVIMYVMIRATYSASVMANASTRDTYKTCINSVKSFLIKNNVDPLLRHRFITYLELCWYTDKAYSITHGKASVTFDLPVHVNQELLNMQRSKYILCLPFVKFLNYAALKEISSRSHIFYTSPNEILLNTGEITNEIYVIKQGFCEVIDPKTKSVVGLKTAKGYFGDLECLLRIPAYYTVRAVTHVQLYSISRKYLTKIISLPNIRNAIRYARTQPEYQALQKSEKEFLQYTIPPRAANREWFPLPRKHEPDTDFLQPFKRLGFFSVLRYVFPRFTVCPDGLYLKRYERFRTVCALLSANIVPVYQLLVLQWPNLYYLLWFLDISAYYDIFQRMLVGYYDDNGILVYHPAITAAHYLKGAFLLDLFACLPLEGLDTMRNRYHSSKQATRYTATSQFLMFNRVMQLYRVPPALSGVIKKYIERQDIGFIFQRMLVGYYDDNGILVYHPAITAAHYLKGAFLLDLFACLPLEGLDTMRNRYHSSKQATRYTATSQFLMFNRVMQLYRVPPALSGVIKKYIERQDIGFIIKTVPFFLALISIVTSVIAEWSVFKYQRGASWLIEYRASIINTTWVYRYQHLVKYKIMDSPWCLIRTAYFWSTSELTCLGFKYFVDTCTCIFYFLILCKIIGTVFLTYSSVRVLSSRCNVNTALAMFQDHMKDFVQFMKREKVSPELSREVLQYYEYFWEKTGGTDYRTVFKLCDQITLRTDAILHIYGKTFGKCPILYDCDLSLLRLLGRAVYSIYLRQGMVVVERNDVISDLFFVEKGTLDIRYTDDDQHVLTKLPCGSVFGNLDDAEYEVCRNRFVACTNMHLLRINSKIFHAVIQDFPETRLLLNKFRPENENYIIGGVQAKSKVEKVWKERSQSTPFIEVSQKGFIKSIHSHIDALQVFIMVVSLVCVLGDTYNAAFQDNNSILIGILYILDMAFFLKIVLNYAMPFISDEESDSRVVLESKRKMYYKGEFKYDVLSCLPIELLCLTSHNPWSLFAYLRLNRMLRVVTVNSCLNRYEEKLNINMTLSSVSKIVIWLALFVHLCACIWAHIGLIEERYEHRSSWRWHGSGRDLSPGSLYVTSLYFVVTVITLVGVGDILPTTLVEVEFVCILMIISVYLYMISVGNIAHIIHYQSFRCFGFYWKFLELQEFLACNRVSDNLVKLCKSYSLYLWREARGKQTPRFLVDAPQVLKEKVMSAVYMGHIETHPVFSQCERAFQRQLVACLQPYYYSEDMYVVKEGEMSGAMFFIHKGNVQELDEEMEETLKLYVTGENFGSFQGFHPESSYSLSYKTTVRSQVLTLYYKDWEYLLNYFPDSKKVIFPPKAPPPSAFIIRKSLEEDDTTTQVKRKVQMTQAPHQVQEFTIDKKDEDETEESTPAPWAVLGEYLSALKDEKAALSKKSTQEIETPVTSIPLEEASPDAVAPPREEASPYPVIERRSKLRADRKTVDIPEDTKPIETSMQLQSSAPMSHEALTNSKASMELETQTKNIELEEFNIAKEPHPESQQEKPESDSHGTVESKGVFQEVKSVFSQLYNLTMKPAETKVDEDKSLPPPSAIKRSSTESEIEDIPKPSYGRRQSTVHGVDRSAVDRELASLKSTQDFQPLTASSDKTTDTSGKTNLLHGISEEEVALKKITYSEYTDQSKVEEEEEVLLSTTKLDDKGLDDKELLIDDKSHSLYRLFVDKPEGSTLYAKSEIMKPDLHDEPKQYLNNKEEKTESLQSLLDLRQDTVSVTRQPEKQQLTINISEEEEKKESLQTLIDLQDKSVTRQLDKPSISRKNEEEEKKESLQTTMDLQDKTVTRQTEQPVATSMSHSFHRLFVDHPEGSTLYAKSEIMKPDLQDEPKPIYLNDKEEKTESLQSILELRQDTVSVTRQPEKQQLTINISEEEDKKESLQTLIDLQDNTVTRQTEKPLTSKKSEEEEKKESLQTLINLQDNTITRQTEKPLTLKESKEEEKKESFQTTIDLQDKTESKTLKEPSILKLLNEKSAESMTSIVSDEPEEEPAPVLNKEVLRRKSFVQKVREKISKTSTSEDQPEGVDTLLIEQDKAAITSLLKELNKKERTLSQVGPSTQIRSGLTFEQPEKSGKLDTLDQKGRLPRSMLMFKDEITTFEVPNKDEPISVIPEPEPLTLDDIHTRSMQAFLSDIALQTKQSTILSDREQMIGVKESVFSLRSDTSGAESIWGVEEFIDKKGTKGDKAAKGTTQISGEEPKPMTSGQKQSHVKAIGYSSEDSSDSEIASSTKAKSARAKSIWGVEDFMQDEGKKSAKKQSNTQLKAPSKGSGKFKLKVNKPTPLPGDETEDEKTKQR